MQRYILGRLLQTVLALLAITVIIFVLTRLTGDPVALMMPLDATQADIEATRKSLGLDRPPVEQYFVFLGNAVRGDFGTSIKRREPALRLVLQRFPATLQLAAVATMVALAIAIPTGILSAVKRGSLLDTCGKLVALVGQSVPVFWLGIMLMLLFAVTWRFLPTSGRGGPQHLVLPAITLGWAVTAYMMRITRSSMLNVLDSEYIKMARIKGSPEWLVVLKHALRNASIPIVTMLGLEFGNMLRGAVVTETVFAWPGVGRLAVEGIHQRDFPIVQAAVVVTAAVFLVINLCVDILYAYLDPRIRY